MTTRVLVTGATGFVAGHCIADLLEHGYAVRGTVRDLAAHTRRAHLTDLARRTGGELEFVAATLDDDAGWAEAVAGCDAVLHVASPFPSAPPDDERALIEPAVEGTLRVLRAAAAAGVRRVVLTSSVAAVAYGHERDEVRTEADWSVVDRIPAYQKSKTLAERAAWDFVESVRGTSELELVVVNPGMVLGPLLEPTTSTSHEPVRRLLNRDVPGSVRTGWTPVDVRDLAVAHRLAMEVPEAAGNRYLCAADPLWMGELAALLAREYGPRGFRVPTRVLPNWLVRLVAVFDKGVRLTVPVLGRTERVSAEKARRELGWTMRPIEETVRDTADSLIAFGVVGTPGARPAAPAAAGTR
ncbi:nucleoside-diphosphate-sugar epimerase [Nocardia neocaledoniensis]|uniref:Nucleoside-diphosphate-sugar epimerase n=2 Tax=Nocardia neocaledoniensis TaxID=236511 RepID=A0A317N6P1_9NOCA|nr:NAD-dependent epimerase/dehydratase family protein [Nocardia neocaledoniensis]PWV70367.1 nucleoside-diphosphate-sugar epimerase [Nocardia neocaledoniensis]